MNQAGLRLLKEFEGFSSDAYRDLVGRPTIGYGFTAGVRMGDKMTREEADARLLEELKRYDPQCSGTENQIAAMTCLAWNIGIESFRYSTVRRKHLAGDFGGAADAFLMWNKAGGHVVPGLTRRRQAERSLYLTPVGEP